VGARFQVSCGSNEQDPCSVLISPEGPSRTVPKLSEPFRAKKLFLPTRTVSACPPFTQFMTLRMMTTGRRLRSAWLLVGGTPGCRKLVNKSRCSGPFKRFRKVSPLPITHGLAWKSPDSG
jgi:hypothetical protein